MEQLYSLKSAAKKLDVSKRTVQRLIKQRPDIEKYKVGSGVRIKESDLKKLVVKQVNLDNIEI